MEGEQEKRGETKTQTGYHYSRGDHRLRGEQKQVEPIRKMQRLTRMENSSEISTDWGTGRGKRKGTEVTDTR
jgi:hypothetical protein